MMVNLAHRAMDCDGWRWLPGMVDVDGSRVLKVTPERNRILLDNLGEGKLCNMRPPDFDDVATAGCLTRLVREAWACGHSSDGGVYAQPVWRPNGDGGLKIVKWRVNAEAIEAPTELEALVMALEAAPA